MVRILKKSVLKLDDGNRCVDGCHAILLIVSGFKITRNAYVRHESFVFCIISGGFQGMHLNVHAMLGNNP